MKDQLRTGGIEDRRADDADRRLFSDPFASHFPRRIVDEKEPLVRARLPDRH